MRLAAFSAELGEGNLIELSAVEAVAQISRGDISAEHYARRCDGQRRAGVHPGALFGLPIPQGLRQYA